MNIFAVIKQVPDTETKIKITGDKKGIEKGDVKWIINPYDEYAIEEALKIKEKLKTGTVTAVTAGPDRTIEALRTAVAMGADNAIHIKIDNDNADTSLVASAIAEVLKKENPSIVFCGKQAIDDDQAAAFSYISELMNVPSVAVVTKVEIAADCKSAKVEREVEGGTKWVVETPLPAMLGLDKGINTPRYASLPGIMKAKKKEIKTYLLADLGLGSETPKTEDSNYELPKEKPAGKKLAGEIPAQVKELVKLLREEAKAI